MTLIQIGTIASAILALITLITKLFDLIGAIYDLIGKLDTLSRQVDYHQELYHQIQLEVGSHAKRIHRLEGSILSVT